jgi:hypothetical protein
MESTQQYEQGEMTLQDYLKEVLKEMYRNGATREEIDKALTKILNEDIFNKEKKEA